jgi:hypothetical protein
MSVTLKVKSSDPVVRLIREAICNKVLPRFRFDTPHTKLLCFVDDVDFEGLKSGSMSANRGGFINNLGAYIQERRPLPDYIKHEYEMTRMGGWGYTSLIHVHGSTCEPRESLILTLAHELQHFTQFSQTPNFYEADFLLNWLLKGPINLPSEHDALLQSKRIAGSISGEGCIDEYARLQVDLLEGRECERWCYFLSLRLTDSITFSERTRSECQRYRTELNAMIAGFTEPFKAGFRHLDFSKEDWWELGSQQPISA